MRLVGATARGPIRLATSSCVGSNGLVATLSTRASPKVGQPFQLDLTNATSGALPVAGFSSSSTTDAATTVIGVRLSSARETLEATAFESRLGRSRSVGRVQEVDC